MSRQALVASLAFLPPAVRGQGRDRLDPKPRSIQGQLETPLGLVTMARERLTAGDKSLRLTWRADAHLRATPLALQRNIELGKVPHAFLQLAIPKLRQARGYPRQTRHALKDPGHIASHTSSEVATVRLGTSAHLTGQALVSRV
jgi:hypothetical protein